MMKFIVVLLSVGVLFSLTACDDTPPKKKRTVQPRAVTKKTSVPVLDNAEVEESSKQPVFRYVTNDRRDPFTSLMVVREPLQTDAEPKTPLQKFGVKELRLTAIVSGMGQTRAMVIAPDKKAYILTVGIKVGRNQGYVKEITTDEVVVEEQFRDFSGGVRTEVKRITLSRGEGK
jgi:type IV pilus assembly protein PilP